MDNEQLENGKKLSAALERLNAQKSAWENCDKVFDLTIKSPKNTEYRVNIDHVNFDLLKTLTLDTINKKIAECQKEFDNL